MLNEKNIIRSESHDDEYMHNIGKTLTAASEFFIWSLAFFISSTTERLPDGPEIPFTNVLMQIV